MDGSVLSLNGLNLTVSNCTLILAGWQQSSCAAGDLALQAVSESRGTVGYQLVGNGSGPNGTDIFAAVGGGMYNSGLYQVSFTLSAATNQAGSMVSGATLSTAGSDDYGCFWYCGSSVTASQNFSAAAGGGTLTADMLSAPTVSTVLAQAKAFTIAETVTMNSWGPQQNEDCWDPQTLDLGSVTQTFKTVTEPAPILVLLSGIAGLVLARRWRGARR
jgi:hypothetical protein